MKSFCLAFKQMRKRRSSYLHVSLVSFVIVVHSLRQRQHTSPILLSSTYLDTTNHIAQHDSGDKRNRIFNHDDTSPSSKAEYTDQKRKFLIALVSVSIIPFPSLPFPSLPVQSSSIVRSMRRRINASSAEWYNASIPTHFRSQSNLSTNVNILSSPIDPKQCASCCSPSSNPRPTHQSSRRNQESNRRRSREEKEDDSSGSSEERQSRPKEKGNAQESPGQDNSLKTHHKNCERHFRLRRRLPFLLLPFLVLCFQHQRPVVWFQ